MTEERVEFENDKVRVLRIRTVHGTAHQPPPRRDRVLIWLRGGRHVRSTQGGKNEDIERHSGEVVWRDASHHSVETGGTDEELVIVELK